MTARAEQIAPSGTGPDAGAATPADDIREANRPRPYTPPPYALVSPETYAALAHEIGVEHCGVTGCAVCSGELRKR